MLVSYYKSIGVFRNSCRILGIDHNQLLASGEYTVSQLTGAVLLTSLYYEPVASSDWEVHKMYVSTFSPAAWHALKAVDIRNKCGRYAASQYAKKHGVRSLYRLACQLSAV